ncbi:MAG TPA: glycoside hydrolase family 16 protein [bacterium]|nr:glycoside hydrolase family 16 protein [bacterium]HQG44153.1 glycoside hydrolase family 16 protein [bacterium]HQI49842.1 glycoside hydrolase family 16 protein [bacterium]HQJ64881.1 glycoside hydrolase family 16 protein [bacterium]
MKSIRLIGLLMVFGLWACEKDSVSADNKPVDKPEGWQLVWSDDFTTNGLPSATRWGYQTGGSGWGNDEKQYYYGDRPENCRVENGMLIIEARKDNFEGHPYTSARLVSRGKGDWTYGRFEIRAKLPAGRGTWPAIWMMPTVSTYGSGGWPDNGEIDIMEHVGYDMGIIHASIHSLKYNHKINTQKTATLKVYDVASKFHDYILEWDATQIRAWVDTTLYFTTPNEGKGWEYWPFDKSFYLILNIAIGGSWGGAQGIDDSIFPQQMVVDYVRVYQKPQ